VVNAVVANNKINGVASLNTTGFSAAGITVAGGNSGANTIYNNMITGVIAPSTAPDILAGIYVIGAAGANTRLYFNSISMTGDRGAVTVQSPSYGIAITGTDPTVDLRNNILYTTQIASGGGADAKSYAIGMVSTTFANLNSNYNAFWSTGTNDGGFRSGSLGIAAGTSYATLAGWAAAVANDANSIETDPLFNNPLSNLHLTTFEPLATPLEGITNDCDCETRSATTPDIGADELINCSVTLSSPTGTNNQTVCINTAITAIIYNTTGATGIGVVTGLPGGVSANWATNVLTISGTPTASGTFNYIGGPCTTGTITGTITVNAIPTAPTITASGPTTFCNGGSVTLNSNVGNNNALNFVKTSSQYVSVPHSASINLGATFTMEAWVKYSGQNVTIVDKGDYDFLWMLNPDPLSSGLNTLKMGFYTKNTGVWSYSTGTVSENTWTHVAITLDAGILTFYVNGVAAGTASVTFSQDALEMNIGRQQPTYCICNHFNGSMDELRLWNIVRTPAQMLTNMNSTIPTNSTGLVAYYKFDEGSGTTTADATGNGNNGTLVNSPTWEAPATSPVNAVVWLPGGATTPSIVVNNAGTYTATVTNGYGCSTSSSTIVNVNSNAALVTLTSPTDDYSTGIILKTASSVNGNITATNKVTGTAKVDYKATSIQLNAGFKADNGTVFNAVVGGCN
jgi:hypothetical protein